MTTCRECFGLGCPMCEEGWVACPDCDGTGMQDGEICLDCEGTGLMFDVDEPDDDNIRDERNEANR